MSGYLNNFMGFVLNFFKRENRKKGNDAAACCSTPPRRCNSVIENRKIKEEMAKHYPQPKSVCSPSNGAKVSQQMRFSLDGNKIPPVYGAFLNQNESNVHERGDGFKSPWECYFSHDAAISQDFPRFLPPSVTRRHRHEHGLRRSCSLESCCPMEDMSSRRTLQMRQNHSPMDSAGKKGVPLDPLKDFTPFSELVDLTPGNHSENSNTSKNIFVEEHRPKVSKIPMYRKKYRPARLSKSLPKQFESVVHRDKEPKCTCFREALENSMQRSWRSEGHAFYCPRSVVAYRSYLNTKLENLFRLISKKKYCGNIIDAASHSRWMRLAGVGVDEDAAYFKQFAKGRVVLPVSEYKAALQQLCYERSLDYWDLVQKMTDIELGAGDSNSTISGWRGGK